MSVLNIISEKLDRFDRAILDNSTASTLRGYIVDMRDYISAAHERDFTTELEILRSECASLTRENQELKTQLCALDKAASGIDDDAVKIIRLLFQSGEDLSTEEICQHLGFQRGVCDYHMSSLLAGHFIRQTCMAARGFGGYQPALFRIHQKGREYVMKNPA